MGGNVLEQTGIAVDTSFIIGEYAFSLLLTIIGFIFKGIALYTMGKRRNFDKLWMAYVPFLNYILLGKIVGKAIIWGKEIKNIGLWVCILNLVDILVSHLINVGYYVYLFEELFKVNVTFNSAFVNNWVSNTGLFFNIVYILSAIMGILKVFLTASLIYLVFRKYKPQSSTLYMIISIFVDFMFGILLFTVRNNEVTTFEDFLRQRRARQQNYYNNYRNGGYNNYNNGYNSYYNNGNNQPTEEDPFPEFSDKKTQENKTNNEFYGNNGESQKSNEEDDLFN